LTQGKQVEAELIVYGPHIDEVARHRLFARTALGQRTEANRPSSEPRQQESLLRQRFSELKPLPLRFFEGLLQEQRYGKAQACKVLALQSTYARVDLLAAGRFASAPTPSVPWNES
jgi:hypothetical protein